VLVSERDIKITPPPLDNLRIEQELKRYKIRLLMRVEFTIYLFNPPTMPNENKTLLERNVISSILSNLDLLDNLDIDIGEFQPKHRELLKAIKENQTNDATILATNSNIPIEDIYDII
jgi:hypothetical protein